MIICVNNFINTTNAFRDCESLGSSVIFSSRPALHDRPILDSRATLVKRCFRHVTIMTHACSITIKRGTIRNEFFVLILISIFHFAHSPAYEAAEERRKNCTTRKTRSKETWMKNAAHVVRFVWVRTCKIARNILGGFSSVDRVENLIFVECS